MNKKRLLVGKSYMWFYFLHCNKEFLIAALVRVNNYTYNICLLIILSFRNVSLWRALLVEILFIGSFKRLSECELHYIDRLDRRIHPESRFLYTGG